MCIADRNDITLAVKVALNLNTANKYVHYRGHIFCPILLKNGQNVCHDDILDELTHYHTIPHFDALKIYSLENIVRREKLHVISNFYFSHNVFYHIWYLISILNAF